MIWWRSTETKDFFPTFSSLLLLLLSLFPPWYIHWCNLSIKLHNGNERGEQIEGKDRPRYIQAILSFFNLYVDGRIAGGAYDQVEQPNSCLPAGCDLWRRESRGGYRERKRSASSLLLQQQQGKGEAYRSTTHYEKAGQYWMRKRELKNIMEVLQRKKLPGAGERERVNR